MASLASFRSFRDMQDRAQASSLRLGTQYAAILGAFKKLIVSIQFHDLTRQHVIEVLRRLCAESPGSGGGRPCYPRAAAGILALQSLQLAHAGLREDLSATRQGFAVGALFAEAVSRARGMLQEVGERNPSPLPLDGSPAPDYGLHDFATNYTMQSEHDVHDVHQGFTVAAPPGQPDSPSIDAGELGENVEFF